ncbi:MAG: outer membrane protein assembly factor BamE [bacterium]|nr:outer membrane protein assembly factor BamE [bacterium]
MHKNYFIISFCYLSLVLVFGVCSGNSFAGRGDLKLELSLKKLDPIAKEIIVQLAVTNNSKYALVIPRLREGLLEKYGAWGGWLLYIRDQQRAPYLYTTQRSPIFTEQDLIILESKETFMVTINVANTYNLWSRAHTSKSKQLAGNEGEYQVTARLHLAHENIPGDLKEHVWRGRRESNTIRFVISSSQTRAAPEKKHSLDIPTAISEFKASSEERIEAAKTLIPLLKKGMSAQKVEFLLGSPSKMKKKETAWFYRLSTAYYLEIYFNEHHKIEEIFHTLDPELLRVGKEYIQKELKKAPDTD